MALGSGNIEIDVTTRVDTSGIVRQVNAAERQLQPLNLRLDDKGFRQPLGRISGDMAEFEKSLDASVARTLAFGAAVGVLNAVSKAFQGMVTSAAQVEKALMDINVILNLSSKSLAQFSEDLFEVAKNTGQAFESVSDAAVELSRQGLGAEETLRRINDAMILTRLSGMDAAKSVETLTAAVNSFGSTALTTTELVNKLATVDAAFAVSTEDLANALARAGSTAQGAKVSLDELLAAVTSVQQITARGGSVIGNAFKSIFTRIQRSSVREALEEIGVATTDATGNIRNAIDIIKDYAGVYKTLSDAQRSYTDELVAGVFQINNFKALVKDLSSDYSIYDRALKQSNSATDEAIRRNSQLQTTLSALMNEASVNVKSLAASLGELVATPAIENLLKIFNSFSGAIANALEGEGMIKTFLMGIGNFIAGPGLIIITVAFVKLFKFITGQATQAIGAIFNIGKAQNKIAEAEGRIGFLLKSNYALYEAITNEALDHKQKEDLVLQTLKAQNQAYQQQQSLISSLSRSKVIQGQLAPMMAGGFVPSASRGFVPNFANGVEGAMMSEKRAIAQGAGGASKSARPKVIKNFPMGKGKKQTVVANTDEVIVPNYMGGSGSAIFNKKMVKKAGGKPKGAIPVSQGFVPNFAKGAFSFIGTEPYESVKDGMIANKQTVDVEALLGGIGMIVAAGPSGRVVKSTIQDPTSKGFLGAKGVRTIIDNIAGSKLNEAEKGEVIARLKKVAKVTYSDVGVSPIKEMSVSDAGKIAGAGGAIDDIIGPYIANATAAVSQKIYSSLFGDEVKSKQLVAEVYNAATTNIKSIATPSTEGSIFEAAVRLGSKASSVGFGGDPKAIWDFEETTNISQDLKEMYFDPIGYPNITRADAKRQASDDMITDVVQKAYSDKGSATWMRERLVQWHTQQYKPLVDAAVVGKAATKATSSSATKAGGFIPNLSGGFVPNFAVGEENIIYSQMADYFEENGTRSTKEWTESDLFLNPNLSSYDPSGRTHKEIHNALFGSGTKISSTNRQRANKLFVRRYGPKLQALGFDPDQDNKPSFEKLVTGNDIDTRPDPYQFIRAVLEDGGPMDVGAALTNLKLRGATDNKGHALSLLASHGGSISDTSLGKHVNQWLNELGLSGAGGAQNNNPGWDKGGQLHGYKINERGGLSGLMSETGANIVNRFKGIKSGAPQSYLGHTKPVPNFLETKKDGVDHGKSVEWGTASENDDLKAIPEIDLAYPNALDNLEATKFSADITEFAFYDPEGKEQTAKNLVDVMSLNDQGFEAAIGAGSSLTRSKAASSPLDFWPGDLGEAKFGANAKRNPAEIVGKLLRYQIAEGKFGTSEKALESFNQNMHDSNLGNLNLFSAYNKGFIPNFAKQGITDLDRASSSYESIKTKQWKSLKSSDPNAPEQGKQIRQRILNASHFFPLDPKRAMMTMYKDVLEAGDTQRPYTDIDAGEIVGPRVPSMLVRSKEMLDRARSRGKNIPFMDIDGFFEPTWLMSTIQRKKNENQDLESGVSAYYYPGEENDVEKYINALGANPESPAQFQLANSPLFSTGFARGWVPNFIRGLFDSDYLPANQGKSKDGIIDSIINGGLPFDVFHGPPGAGKSTLARNMFPHELIASLDHFEGMQDQWTEFSVVSGTQPSRGLIKEGAPQGLAQYTPRAQRILLGARKIFALTPDKKTLETRRATRMKLAELGKTDPSHLPDQRSAGALAAASSGSWLTDPDISLYDELEQMGKPVTRMANDGLIPNFAIQDNILSQMDEAAAYSETTRAQGRAPIEPSRARKLLDYIKKTLSGGAKWLTDRWGGMTPLEKGLFIGGSATPIPMGGEVAVQASRAAAKLKDKDFRKKLTDELNGYISGPKDPGNFNNYSGLIPNFEETYTVHRGQGYSREYTEPNIHDILFEPLLNAQTPEDVLRIAQNFSRSHASGALSGSLRDKGSGELADKFLDYIAKWRYTTRGGMEEFETAEDPYSSDFISRGGRTDKRRHEDEPSELASGATSHSSNPKIADAFKDQLTQDMGFGPPGAKAVFETEVSSRNVFGKKKLLRLLNLGAKPPNYPMVDKLKTKIRDGSFKTWWADNGGLYLNLDARRNDPKLADLEDDMGKRPGAIYDQPIDSIYPKSERDGDIYSREQELIGIVGDNKRRINRTYPSSSGLIPNFAWKKKEGINYSQTHGNSGNRLRSIAETSSYLSHRGDQIGMVQSNRKGDANVLFNDLFEEKGSAYSESLKQNRSFKQGSKTNFEDLVYAFPQLQYRMKENATTTGDFIDGPNMKSHRFYGIKDLKSRVNKMDRPKFQETLGNHPGTPGMNVYTIGNLTTTTTDDRNKADNIYKDYARGFIPNFANKLSPPLNESFFIPQAPGSALLGNEEYNAAQIQNAIRDVQLVTGASLDPSGVLNMAMNYSAEVNKSKKPFEKTILNKNFNFDGDGPDGKPFIPLHSADISNALKGLELLGYKKGKYAPKIVGRPTLSGGPSKEALFDSTISAMHGLIPNFAEQVSVGYLNTIAQQKRGSGVDEKYSDAKGKIADLKSKIEKEGFDPSNPLKIAYDPFAGIGSDVTSFDRAYNDFSGGRMGRLSLTEGNHRLQALQGKKSILAEVIGAKLWDGKGRAPSALPEGIKSQLSETFGRFFEMEEDSSKMLSAAEFENEVSNRASENNIYGKIYGEYEDKRSGLENKLVDKGAITPGPKSPKGMEIKANRGYSDRAWDVKEKWEKMWWQDAYTRYKDKINIDKVKNLENWVSGQISERIEGTWDPSEFGVFNEGFIPNFAKGMESKKAQASSKILPLQQQWVQAVKRKEDIGKTMGLGKGGTESRASMPQLSDTAQTKFESDLTKGQGIAGDLLKGQKVSIKPGIETVSNLKATQKDIYGDNVLSKLQGAFGDTWDQAGKSTLPGWLAAPIMVSKENKILDGHHRWATVYARDAIDDGILGGLAMQTSKIGLPIQTLLQLAETYSGAKHSGAGTAASEGLIPNFADALQAAIGREKAALKSQGSNAKVYIDQDSRLKGPRNPGGLLVANKRDEPRSGSQGVNRAIANRMDPKRHGAARGMIPNFASEEGGGGSGFEQKDWDKLLAFLKLSSPAAQKSALRIAGLIDNLDKLSDIKINPPTGDTFKEFAQIITDEIKKALDEAAEEVDADQLVEEYIKVQTELKKFKDLPDEEILALAEASEKLSEKIMKAFDAAKKAGESGELTGDQSKRLQEAAPLEKANDRHDKIREVRERTGWNDKDKAPTPAKPDQMPDEEPPDINILRKQWIEEYNAQVDAINQGANDLNLPDEKLAEEIEKLNAISVKLKGEGNVDIQKAMESDTLKTLNISDEGTGEKGKGPSKLTRVMSKVQSEDSKALIKSSQAIAAARHKEIAAQKKLEESQQNALAKIMGFQMAMSQISSFTDIDLSNMQGFSGSIQALESVAPKTFQKLGALGPALTIGAAAAGLAIDLYHEYYDAEKLMIKELEKEMETRKDSIDTITKNIEKIDEFANATAKFSEATRTGDVESAGKFMQSIFDNAQDVAGLDPKAFEEVIQALGDTEKLNKAVDSFKNAASAGKNLKQVEHDIAGMMVAITKSVDEAQVYGIEGTGGKVNTDIREFKDDIDSIGRSLTQNLSDEKALALSRALEGFDTRMGSSSKTLFNLSGVIGEFDESTKKSLAGNQKLSQGILEQIKIQNEYRAAVIRAKQAFAIVQKPIHVLNDNLNELATALDIAAASTQSAFDVLMQVGEIEGGANIESLKSSGTISETAMATGQAAGQNQNSLLKASQAQASQLKSFASEMIKSAKEGTVTLSAPLQQIVNGVQSGSTSNEAAIKALLEVQKTGTPEEKEATTKTIDELRKINQSQIKDTAITNANLKAQLQKLDAQAINTQRTANISDSQLTAFSNMNQSLEAVKGSSLETMQKIAEMTGAIQLLESMGADQDILSELKESNAQLNQLEALRALAESTTGQDFQATSLKGLQDEIDGFIMSGAFNNLKGAAQDTVVAVSSATEKGIQALQDAGTKGDEDAKAATLIEFQPDALTNLSESMGKAVSDALASALGIGPEIAESINKSVNIDSAARSIEKLSIQNTANAKSNLDHQTRLNDALLESMRAADFGGLADSSTALERAAVSLNQAADKIIGSDKFAAGFVPNFAPTDSVSRALSAEKRLGAKRPVVDSHPSIGTYVRDDDTQPTFGAVKRDHPEGLKQASENSRATQSAINANAFMPETFTPDLESQFTRNANGLVPNFAKEKAPNEKITTNEWEKAFGKSDKRKRVDEYLAGGGRTRMQASGFPGWSSIKDEIYRQTGLEKENPLRSGYEVNLDYPPYKVLGGGSIGGFDPASEKVWLSEFPTKDTPMKALSEIQSVLANETIHWIQNKYRKELGKEDYQQWIATKLRQQDDSLGGVGFGPARYAESFKDIGYDGKSGAHVEFLKGKRFSQQEMLKRFNLDNLNTIPSLEELMEKGTPAEAWLLNDLKFYAPRIMDQQEALWKNIGLTHKRAMGIKEITSSVGVERGQQGYLLEKAQTNWPKFRKTGDPLDLELTKFEVGAELDMFLNDPDFRDLWFDEGGNSKFLKDPMGTFKSIESDFGAESMKPLYSLIKDIQGVNKKNKDTGKDGYADLHTTITDVYNTSISKLLGERMSHMASIGVRNLQKEQGGLPLRGISDVNKFSGFADGFVPNFAPMNPVSRALSTERGMGAKRPVVDSHPSVGTYVRDAATQPNFGAVKRDHPEGLRQASKNSRAIQSVTNSRGFVPNFVSYEDLIGQGYKDDDIGPFDPNKATSYAYWNNAVFGDPVTGVPNVHAVHAMRHWGNKGGLVDGVAAHSNTPELLDQFAEGRWDAGSDSEVKGNRLGLIGKFGLRFGDARNLQRYWETRGSEHNPFGLGPIIRKEDLLDHKNVKASAVGPFAPVKKWFDAFSPYTSIKDFADFELEKVHQDKALQPGLFSAILDQFKTGWKADAWIDRYSSRGRRVDTDNTGTKFRDSSRGFQWWDQVTDERKKQLTDFSHIGNRPDFKPEEKKKMMFWGALAEKPRTHFERFPLYKDILENQQLRLRFLAGTGGSDDFMEIFKMQYADQEDLSSHEKWSSVLQDEADSITPIGGLPAGNIEMMKYLKIGEDLYKRDYSELGGEPLASKFLKSIPYADAIREKLKKDDSQYLIPLSLEAAIKGQDPFLPAETNVRISDKPAMYSVKEYKDLITNTDNAIKGQEEKLNKEQWLKGSGSENEHIAEKAAGQIKVLKEFKDKAMKYAQFFNAIHLLDPVDSYFNKPFWIEGKEVKTSEAEGVNFGVGAFNFSAEPWAADFLTTNSVAALGKGPGEKYKTFIEELFPEKPKFGVNSKDPSSAGGVKKYLENSFPENMSKILFSMDQSAGLSTANTTLSTLKHQYSETGGDMTDDMEQALIEKAQILTEEEKWGLNADETTILKKERVHAAEEKIKKNRVLENQVAEAEAHAKEIKEQIKNFKIESEEIVEKERTAEEQELMKERDLLYNAILGQRRERITASPRGQEWIQRRDQAQAVTQAITERNIPSLRAGMGSLMGIVSQTEVKGSRRTTVPQLQERIKGLQDAQNFYQTEEGLAYVMSLGGLNTDTGFNAHLGMDQEGIEQYELQRRISNEVVSERRNKLIEDIKYAPFSKPQGDYLDIYNKKKELYSGPRGEAITKEKQDDVLEMYKDSISRDPKRELETFAQIQMGNIWLNRFKAADGGKVKQAYNLESAGVKPLAEHTERGRMLRDIGMHTVGSEGIKGFFNHEFSGQYKTKLGFTPDDVINSFAKNSDPGMKFFAHELLNNKEAVNDPYRNMVLNKISEIGVPFNDAAPIENHLKNKRLDFLETDKGPGSIRAVDDGPINNLVGTIQTTQRKGIIAQLNRWDPTKYNLSEDASLAEIITGAKLDQKDLHKNPHYLKYEIEKGENDYGKEVFKSYLNDPGNVENYDQWKEFYGNQQGAGLTLLKGEGGPSLLENTEYGTSRVSKDIKSSKVMKFEQGKGMFNPFAEFDPNNEHISPAGAVSKVIQGVRRGKNSWVDNFLSGQVEYPFPKLGTPPPAEDFLRAWFYENFGSTAPEEGTAMKDYMPFGYKKNQGRIAPEAEGEGRINQLFHAIKKWGLSGMENEVEKDLHKDEDAKTNAKGFVPNFSKIAGEIAASKTAGYKTPVRPSQVKSINIPGVGKSSYNTQESVFKAKGMSQPFIRPPASSKAAKPYAKKVQKKFNFNPYGKQSADGFVPNFFQGPTSSQFEEAAKRFSSSVGMFERSGSSLGEAFDRMDFTKFSDASNNILEASKEFAVQSGNIKDAADSLRGGEPTQGVNQAEINFEPLTKASGEISSSVSALSEQLRTPLTIDASGLSAVVKTMQNIQLSVNVPSVDVNVQGVAGAADQIKQSVGQEVENRVKALLAEQSFVTATQINSWFGTNFS